MGRSAQEFVIELHELAVMGARSRGGDAGLAERAVFLGP